MKYGYYTDLDELQEDYPEADFGFLANEFSAGGFTPYDFLHGYCYEFAGRLSELYGHKMRAVKSLNGDELIHAYCVDESGRYYDVRGWTDDYRLLMHEFPELKNFAGRYVDAPEKWMPETAYERAYMMANCIISENPDFYKYKY